MDLEKMKKQKPEDTRQPPIRYRKLGKGQRQSTKKNLKKTKTKEKRSNRIVIHGNAAEKKTKTKEKRWKNKETNTEVGKYLIVEFVTSSYYCDPKPRETLALN